MKRALQRAARGFLLFETMLAVTIFSMAVLALGRCVDNCLRAEILLQDDDRARRALENRMAEIEAGAVAVGDPATESLKGMFDGMKLRQSRRALTLKNELDEEVTGLDEITLQLEWKARGESRERSLQFYVQTRGR